MMMVMVVIIMMSVWFTNIMKSSIEFAWVQRYLSYDNVDEYKYGDNDADNVVLDDDDVNDEEYDDVDDDSSNNNRASSTTTAHQLANIPEDGINERYLSHEYIVPQLNIILRLIH